MTTTPLSRSRWTERRLVNRRGSALILVLIFTTGLAALAMAAIFMTGTSRSLSGINERDHEMKYAAEAAMAMGKSRLNMDALALPDSGVDTLQVGATLVGADGQPIPWVRSNLYIGPTGSTTGQFGRFASVVADVSDPRGGRVIRRLELTQESFAKFAYWSNRETSGFGTIYFGSGDVLFGPVWSNDVISISSSGASFRDEVGTARTISGRSYGSFAIPPRENQTPIPLPSTAMLARLSTYATTGSLNFTAPTSGDETTVRMRIEFLNTDLNADGDSLDANEGFIKVYTANSGNTGWLRGTLDRTSIANNRNCGDWHPVLPGGDLKFFPASIHNTAWFRALMIAGGMTTAQADAERIANLQTIMSHTNARCYAGGDPHLVAIERNSASWLAPDKEKGGDDTTFTATGVMGAWRAYPIAVDSRVTLARPRDAGYLFPLSRDINPDVKGVIYVNGTVGVSGVVRGRVTLHSNQYIVIVDDLTYATDPSAATRACRDILGMIASRDVVVADNAMLTPQNVSSSGTAWRMVDDSRDLWIHSVIMAVSTSFRVERYNSGPTSAQACETTPWGRGCLRLTGGIIQDSRGAVGTSSGTGFIKRYSYDRCAATSPPPYFPTTGRYLDNRYSEIDPKNFDVVAYYRSLTPTP